MSISTQDLFFLLKNRPFELIVFEREQSNLLHYIMTHTTDQEAMVFMHVKCGRLSEHRMPVFLVPDPSAACSVFVSVCNVKFLFICLFNQS